jgi:MFS family permease
MAGQAHCRRGCNLGCPIAESTAVPRPGINWSFFGWRIVLALALMRFVGSGIGIYGRGVLLIPMEQDLNVGRDMISLLFAATILPPALLGPIGGRLMDRFGGRRVLVASAIVAGMGFVVLLWVNSFFALVLVYMGLISLAFNWCIWQAPTAITNNWFLRNKALGLSFLSAGAGAGGLVLVPVVEFLVDEFGWRVTSAIGGVAVALAGIGVGIIVRNRPSEKGLEPDGIPAPVSKTSASSTGQSWGFTAHQALRTRLFWLMLVGSILWLAVELSMQLHFFPLLVSKGASTTAAAWFTSLFAALTLPGVLLVGWLSDRFDGRNVLSFFGLFMAAAMGILLVAGSAPGYLLATLLLAPVDAIWPVLWAIIGREYGPAHYNTIRGTIYGLILYGSLAWQWLPGVVFERTDSYDAWLIAMVVVAFTTTAVFWVAARSKVGKPASTAA